MDEDVLLFSRLSYWYKKDKVYKLNSESLSKEYEVLVLKKDGQLIVKSGNETHEDMNKLVYIWHKDDFIDSISYYLTEVAELTLSSFIDCFEDIL